MSLEPERLAGPRRILQDPHRALAVLDLDDAIDEDERFPMGDDRLDLRSAENRRFGAHGLQSTQAPWACQQRLCRLIWARRRTAGRGTYPGGARVPSTPRW